MSRIGKKPVFILSGVTVAIKDSLVSIKGPKGELTLNLPAGITVSQVKTEAGADALEVIAENPADMSAIWGTIRAHLNNMMTGVTTGWSKTLELNGVGFRMNVAGQTLNMSLGFSHEVKFPLPNGVKATAKDNVLTIEGADRQTVGQVAATIRSFKKPEPYKGKGFKYSDEVVRRKLGKQAKSE